MEQNNYIFNSFIMVDKPKSHPYKRVKDPFSYTECLLFIL